MPISKYFLRKHALSAGLIAILVAGSLGGSFILNTKTEEAENARNELKKANTKISKLTEDLGTITAESASTNKELADLKNKIADQASDIESFAKQAAACDNLKKQLKIKK